MVQLDRYPNLEGLVGLAQKNGVDIGPTLLRVLTDLYVQKPAHSPDEERHFSELALRLIGNVDAGTRRTVAARLAAYPGAPVAVVERLAEEMPQLSEPAPIAAGNEAKPDLSELFFAADATERHLILLNLDYAPIAAASPAAPTAASEAVRKIEAAALARNIPELVRILEQTLGIGRAQAERVVQDSSGEPMIVAAKSLGMRADMLQRIILFINPAVGLSVERVYRLSRLYDEITPEAALRMLAIWRGHQLQTRRRPAHQPLFWDDDRSSARSVMTPAARRAPRNAENRERIERERGPARS